MKRIQTNINHSGHSRKHFLNALSGISLVLFLTLMGCSKPENRLIAEFYNPEQSYKVVAFERIVKDSTTLEMSVFPYQKEINKRDKGNIFSAKVDESVEIEDILVDWETNNWSRVILPLGLRDSRKVHDTTLYYQNFSFGYCKCQTDESKLRKLVEEWAADLKLLLPKPPPPPPPPGYRPPKIKAESLFGELPEAFIEISYYQNDIYLRNDCNGSPFVAKLSKREFKDETDRFNSTYLPYTEWHDLAIDSITERTNNYTKLNGYHWVGGKKAEVDLTIRNGVCNLPFEIYSIEYFLRDKPWKQGYFIPVDSIKNYPFINTCKSSIKKIKT